MKRIHQILNILIGSSLGVFIGRSLYTWYDFKTQPILYVLRSAPWYTGVLLEGALTAVIITIAFAVKFFIKKRMEKES